MAEGLTKRGKNSWRIKFDTGPDPKTGKRRTEYVTFRGNQKEAQAERRRLMTQRDEGTFVRKSIATVGDYADHWLAKIAPSKASAKTLERYGENIKNHISPQIGKLNLQKLEGPQIDEFYEHLRTVGRLDGKGGLSAQTIVHIHRLLSQILDSAILAKKLKTSPMLAVQTTPKVRKDEIQVLDDDEQKQLLQSLKEDDIYMPVLCATSTGARRGEVLAVRWRDIDLVRGTMKIAQVVEQTKDRLAMKEPKTPRSRRTIALPARFVQALKEHKKAQAELRLKLGLGKAANDLVFPTWEGEVREPRGFSKDFKAAAKAAGVGHITLHGLRHTHITHLLRSGVPVHVVSERAGHANPSVTLNIYAHLLPGQQEGAAAVVDSALRSALGD